VANHALYEQLDTAIDQLLDGQTPHVHRDLTDLMQLAGNLRTMPSADFRQHLRSDLEDHALFIAAGRTYRRDRTNSRVLQMPRREAAEFISPTRKRWETSGHNAESALADDTLFRALPATYPVHRTNLLASFLLHTMALALLVTSGAWFVTKKIELTKTDNLSADLSPYVLTVAPKASGGGGGGGDRDKLDAPQGRLPRQAREQFNPPAMVLRNNNPKLPMEPTVIAPPVNIATNLPNLGDPYSRVPLGPPSNGTGSGGGIGTGYGSGVGSGRGPGVGPGFGGGIGGGIYRVGGGVSAPHILYAPDPSYSEEARKAKYQGTVVLWTVIGSDGRPRDIKIARSLGMGLDEKAIEALKLWKFEPALKDGRPVSVQINVEVNFRLY